MKCDCVKKLNKSKLMVENNSHVATATMINMKTGATREVINIPLTKRSITGPRMKAKFITASFCPFCGMNQSVKEDK